MVYSHFINSQFVNSHFVNFHLAQSTYLQVLSCEGVQFSGDLSRQTVVLPHRLLAFHLGTNLLAAQVTQLVPVVCLKTNCSRKDGEGVCALVSDLVLVASLSEKEQVIIMEGCGL